MRSMVSSVTTGFRNLIHTLTSLAKVAIRVRYAHRLPPAQTPTCALLGNGPSLTASLAQHADFLQKTDLLCVNNFAQSDWFFTLKPSQYLLHDPAYFTYRPSPDSRPDIAATFAALVTVHWPFTLYLPHFAQHSYIAEHVKNHPAIRVFFYNYTVLHGFDAVVFPLVARGLGMPQCQNVMMAALTLLIDRDYPTVYLFGADSSWHEQIRIDEANRVLMQQPHFYDKTQTPDFQPLFTNHHRQQTQTLAGQFFSLYKTFSGYERLQRYARYRHVRVLNASAKSYIDAFERAMPPLSTPSPVAHPTSAS